MTNELQPMSVIKQTLVNQNQQGEALIALIERFEAQEKRIDGKINEVEELVDSATKQMTINYDEQKDIQSLINVKANELAKSHLTNNYAKWSENLFKAWKGFFIRKIYSKLKNHMNVVRYTSIKRNDFAEAKTYINNLQYGRFTLRELHPTPGIIQVMLLEEKGAS